MTVKVAYAKDEDGIRAYSTTMIEATSRRDARVKFTKDNPNAEIIYTEKVGDL